MGLENNTLLMDPYTQALGSKMKDMVKEYTQRRMRHLNSYGRRDSWLKRQN